MTKQELLTFLKENLTIHIDEKRDWGGKGIEVWLELEGEKITHDYLFTETWRD